MNALEFKVELVQPLLVTELSSREENSARSLDYIPGSVLRNALAARYIQQNSLKNAAADPRCRQLFFEGNVHVLNCLPEDRNQQRSFPIPFSWYCKKENLAKPDSEKYPLTVIDAAVNESSLLRMDDARLLAADGAFCTFDGDIEFVNVERTSAVHIARKHGRRLDSKRDTQVFSYESLAAGQAFCGVILANDVETLDEFRAMLQRQADLNIGGSRSAGYGRVHIRDVHLHTTWTETGAREETEIEEHVTVTLFSDVIARDAQGQFMIDIGPLLGLNVQPERCYRRVKTVGGFNRKWGLPTPQAYAIQMGSVFVYKASDEDIRRLQQFVERGIGERRGDGYGRIAINWNTRDSLRGVKISKQESGVSTVVLSLSSQQMAQRIVNHEWRVRLDRALLKAIRDINSSGNIPNAALTRVRLAAREAVFTRDLKPVKDVLASIKDERTGKPKPAAKSLEKVHIGRDNLYKWLEERLGKLDADDQLEVDSDWMRSFSIGNARPAWTSNLKAEYTARLIEGVIKKQIKAQKARKEAGR